MNTALPRIALLATVLVGCLVVFVHQSSSSTSSFQGIGFHHHHPLWSDNRLLRRPTPSSSAAESRHARCVREGGFFKGDWQHEPFAVRPEYVHGNNKWGKEHQAFRAQHPLPDALQQDQLVNDSTLLTKSSSSSNATAASSSSAALLQESPLHLPYNQYSWVPHADCFLKAFDRAHMCRLLREHLQARHLLFVGDSITEQQSMSLLLLMGGPSVYNWGQHPTPFTLCNATAGEGAAGHEAVTLSFLRDDYLNTSAAAPWVQHLHAHKPDFVLFNMGAHFYDEPSFQAATDRVLSFVKTDAVLSSPTTRLVYRTSVHGHPDCTQHKKPVTPASQPWKSFPGNFTTKFHWDLHPQFNAYTLSRLQAEGLVGKGTQEEGSQTGMDDRVLVLPADALLSSRPDGHYEGPKVDCLHYKMPGPSDWSNFLLFNLWDAQYARKEGRGGASAGEGRRGGGG